MLDWFRSWHGAPTDTKWLMIGKRAGVAPGAVSAIVWALLDHASQRDDRGSVADFDIEAYAVFSGFEEDKIKAVYDALEAKGVIVNGRIAKWDSRQENKSTERVRKHRGKDAAPELPLDAPAPEKIVPPATPSPREIETPTPADTIPSDAENGLITPQAMDLADEIAGVAGHDIKFVPPAWCGAASRVQTWLNADWPPALILQSVKAQMHRKRDGPPDRIRYFERGIAQAIAEQGRPLPTVVQFPSETVQARYGKSPVSSSITAAADRLIAELETGSSSGGEGAARLLPKG